MHHDDDAIPDIGPAPVPHPDELRGPEPHEPAAVPARQAPAAPPLWERGKPVAPLPPALAARRSARPRRRSRRPAFLLALGTTAILGAVALVALPDKSPQPVADASLPVPAAQPLQAADRTKPPTPSASAPAGTPRTTKPPTKRPAPAHHEPRDRPEPAQQAPAPRPPAHPNPGSVHNKKPKPRPKPRHHTTKPRPAPAPQEAKPGALMSPSGIRAECRRRFPDDELRRSTCVRFLYGYFGYR